MKKQALLTNQIAAQLAESVGSGQFSPGDRITTSAVAEQFDASRRPVIEALKILEKKGLVVSVPNRGFFVANNPPKVTPQTIREIAPGEDEAYFRIAEDRLIGRLPDEFMLSDIQKLYGVSRNLANRILARMAREGWVEQKAGYGWRFLPMLSSPEAFRESYNFRAVIEPAAILSPGYAADREELLKLRQKLTELVESDLSKLTLEQLFRIGCEFHETIVGYSKNPFFLSSLEQVNKLRRLVEYRKKVDRSRVKKQHEEHLEILDCLLAEEFERAAELLYAHLTGSAEYVADRNRPFWANRPAS